MGRVSILDKIYNEMKIENSYNDYWLVAYDFPGSKGNPHFYTLFKQLLNKSRKEGTIAQRIQSSIFYTNDIHAAIAATRLSKHYGADVRLFKAEEMDLQSINRAPASIPDFEFILNAEEIPYVLKAVYHKLKQNLDFRYSDETDQLCTFLWANMRKLRPETPIYKEFLAQTLREFSPLEIEVTSQMNFTSSFVLTMENIIPVVKSMKNYLQEYQNEGAPTEESIILYNILGRLIEDDNLPPEVAEVSISEIMKERPSDKWSTKHDK